MREINVITGCPVITVADVISYTERTERRKLTIAEIGRRYREFEQVAEQANESVS